MYKAYLFDLDGTLLDTLDDLADSVNFALVSLGLPERTRDEVRCFVGNGIQKLMLRAVPEGTPPETEAAAYEEFKRHYAENSAVKTKPYPGIKAMLDELKTRGCKLGVITNKKDSIAKGLIEGYFPGVFDLVFGEREGVPKKPAPDAVWESMRLLGADTESTVYIGDSDVDYKTAENAHLPCILVSWGFRERELLEQCGSPIVDSTDELIP